MTYLLDTNFCIELLNQRDSQAAHRLASVNPREVRLCSVVKAELFHGAYKSGRESNLNLIKSFTALFESLPFDDRSAEVYGHLRTELEKQGKLIGPNDLLSHPLHWCIVQLSSLIIQQNFPVFPILSWKIGRENNLPISKDRLRTAA